MFRKQFTLFANSATEIAGVVIENGKMITETDHSGKNYILISSLLVNHWYSVKFALDLSSKTYDVYIVSIDILPGVGHTIHFDAELAYFFKHYLSTHSSP